MWSKLFKLTGLLFAIAFLVITLAFTSHESKNIVCRNIEVDFKTNDIIKINSNEILKLVKSADENIVGKTLDQINTEVIEREVEKHEAQRCGQLHQEPSETRTQVDPPLADRSRIPHSSAFVPAKPRCAIPFD